MGLWSKGIAENMKGREEGSDVDPELEKSVIKEIDWEERHFQICIALIARTDIGLRGATNSPRFKEIIRKADEMVSLLKEHNQLELINKEK